MRPVILLALALTGAAPAPIKPIAAPQALAVLQDFAPGAWDSRELGRQWGTQSLCLASAEMLLFRAAPRPAGCKVTVLRDDPAKGAVSYECPGGLTGRTDIRRDNETSYQVDAQGIADQLPFATRQEFRRAGDCPAREATPAKEPPPALK